MLRKLATKPENDKFKKHHVVMPIIEYLSLIRFIYLSERGFMPQAPLISKIRCYNPNKTKSRVCNRNHLIYIGTREGVDLSATESHIENMDDGKITVQSANDLYAHYIAERPLSHGLFGNIDVSDINQVANQLADLTAQGKVIYRGIVSLSEADALQLGYTQKENWVNFMRATLPDVARVFNIPIDQLRWTAAVHMEQSHPHCHYMFWSEGACVTDPYIHTSKQNQCRELLSKEMFKAEREQELLNKTMQRDLILDLGKDILNDNMDKITKVKNASQIMGRIDNATLGKYGQALIRLSAKLPEHGRLSYQYLPPETKQAVDCFISDILKQHELSTQYNAFLKTIDNISATYSASPKHAETNRQIADEDLRKRLANAALKCCSKLIHEQNIFDHYIDRTIYLSENQPDISSGAFTAPHDNSPAMDQDPDIVSVSFDPDDRIPHADIASTSMEPTIDHTLHLPADAHHYVYKYTDNYKAAMNYIYNKADHDIAKAVPLLQEEANQNNLLACIELGKLYKAKLIPGIDQEKSLATGDAYYRHAVTGLQTLIANAKEPSTSKEIKFQETLYYKLGKLYERGNGTDISVEKAQSCYQAAAHNKYAQYALGSMYLYEKIESFTAENKNELMKKGLSYIKASADQSFAYAAYTYAKNADIVNMPAETQSYYYNAALQEFEKMLEDRAEDNLLYRIGTMYYSGHGTPADPGKAYDYFVKAAEFKNVHAQYALGKTYADPESSHYDLDKAIKYFELSQEQGNTYATYELGKIYLDQDKSHYDAAKGISYLEAVKEDNVYALTRLGKIYLTGIPDINPDIEKALSYLKEAAEKGNDNAQYALGKIYLDNESDYYDPEKGIKLLESIKDKNMYALAKLGNVYLWGKHPGIDQDVEKGLSYLKEAAEKGNEYAQTSIDIYNDVQHNRGINFAIGAGYKCFRILFSTLGSARQSQQAYAADQIYRSLSKAAQKSRRTEQGKYVDQDVT